MIKHKPVSHLSPVYPASQSQIGIPDSTVHVPCLPHGLGLHTFVTVGVCIGYNSSCISISVIGIINIIIIFKLFKKLIFIYILMNYFFELFYMNYI